MKKAKPREIDKQLGLVLARGGAEVGNGERVVRSEGRQELIKSTTTTTTKNACCAFKGRGHLIG